MDAEWSPECAQAVRDAFGLAGGHQATAEERRRAYEAFARLRAGRSGRVPRGGLRNSLDGESPYVRAVFGG